MSQSREPVDVFIENIRKTMATFEAKSAQAAEQDKCIENLKRDVNTDSIEPGQSYPLGRYRLKTLFLSEEETKNNIKYQLHIPKEVNIKFEKSSDPHYKKVSIDGADIESILEHIKKEQKAPKSERKEDPGSHAQEQTHESKNKL